MIDGSPLEHLRALVSGIRFGQFASVGLLGFLVDTAVLAFFIELGLLGPVFAKPISAEAAIVVMFVINERWTFSEWGSAGRRALGRRFVKSNAVRVGGAAVAYVVLLFLLAVTGLHYVVANTIGIVAGFAVNYVAESLFTWRVSA